MSLIEGSDMEQLTAGTQDMPDIDNGQVLPANDGEAPGAEAMEATEFQVDRRITILQSQDEAPWVEAAKQKAFAEIVNEFEGPLMRFVTNMIGANDAEDVVQNTFVRAYRAIGSFEQRHENGLSQWFYTIARRLALNASRDKKTDMITQSMTYASSTGPESVPITNQPSRIGIPGEQMEFREMLSVVDMLAPIHRSVLILSAEGYSQEEIAEIEGISVGALKGRLSRGCAAAHRILERMDKVPKLALTADARQAMDGEEAELLEVAA